ncbi:MAG: hypothetical protein ACOYWZ_08725 [Bacillota bacterium]
MLELEISTRPTTYEVLKAVDKIEREIISDLRDFGDTAKEIVLTSFKKRFATENKGQWAALSHAYKKWKERHYPGMPILQLTQALIRAVMGEGAGHIDNKTPEYLEFGVEAEEIPQARHVQDMDPSRVWCEMYPEDVDILGKAFAGHIRLKADEILKEINV